MHKHPCNSQASIPNFPQPCLPSGHFDGAIRFWDLRTFNIKPVAEVVKAHQGAGGHAAQVVSLVPFKRGGQLLSLGKDSRLRLVDLKAGYRVCGGRVEMQGAGTTRRLWRGCGPV